MDDAPDDSHPTSVAGPDDPPAVSAPRAALLGLVVVLVGLAGVAIAVATGRTDTALLFVGVPCLLAFAVGMVRGRAGWGVVFQVVTVVLLLASALLQEAAVCVLIAAPLVYGVAALGYGVVRATGRGVRAVVAAPILAVVVVEGVLPTRIHPGQAASAEAWVAAGCADVIGALERGPRIDPAADRGPLLRVFPYPTPTAASGPGLEVGDRWTLQVAGGALRTRVVERSASSVAFVVDEDTSRLGRWVAVRGGALSWAQEDGGCRSTMTVDYTRALDPAIYFGPVTDVFMDAGATAFLASLD